MATPVVAQKSPFSAEVESEKSYQWCASDQSKRQPFCDGSHKDTEFSPTEFKPDTTKTVWYRGCKNIKLPALCDSSHNAL